MSEEEFSQVQEYDPYEELTRERREDLNELIQQGCLTESFDFGGHSFVIRTLNAREEWAAAKAMKPYQGTLREPDAYMAAIVGLALVSYDGNPDFHLRNNDNIVAHAEGRLNFVGNWDTVVVAECFRQYQILDQRRTVARRSAVNL